MASADVDVFYVRRILSNEQVDGVLSLGMADYTDAYRIDAAEVTTHHLAKAKSAWDMELSKHLSSIQFHAQAGTVNPPVNLILAQESTSRAVVGFLLANQLDHPQIRDIRFVVVLKEYRHHGILNRMIRALADEHPVITLDCKNERFFQSSGFVVTGKLGNHTTMQLGTLPESVSSPRANLKPDTSDTSSPS